MSEFNSGLLTGLIIGVIGTLLFQWLYKHPVDDDNDENNIGAC